MLQRRAAHARLILLAAFALGLGFLYPSHFNAALKPVPSSRNVQLQKMQRSLFGSIAGSLTTGSVASIATEDTGGLRSSYAASGGSSRASGSENGSSDAEGVDKKGMKDSVRKATKY